MSTQKRFTLSFSDHKHLLPEGPILAYIGNKENIDDIFRAKPFEFVEPLEQIIVAAFLEITDLKETSRISTFALSKISVPVSVKKGISASKNVLWISDALWVDNTCLYTLRELINIYEFFYSKKFNLQQSTESVFSGLKLSEDYWMNRGEMAEEASRIALRLGLKLY